MVSVLLIILILVVLNFLLLTFSCNKSSKKGIDKTKVIKPNLKLDKGRTSGLVKKVS